MTRENSPTTTAATISAETGHPREEQVAVVVTVDLLVGAVVVAVVVVALLAAAAGGAGQPVEPGGEALSEALLSLARQQYSRATILHTNTRVENRGDKR